MMRCCVIGGAGFIGTWLVRELLASGREVTVLGRRPTRPVHLPEAARYVSVGQGEWDWSAQLADAHEVIDLAYATVPETSYADPVFDISRQSSPYSWLCWKPHATCRCARWSWYLRAAQLCGHASTLPIVESSLTNPVSPYGITKLTQEKYSLMFHRLHGVPISIVRPANAYGVGQQPFTVTGVHCDGNGRDFEPSGCHHIWRLRHDSRLHPCRRCRTRHHGRPRQRSRRGDLQPGLGVGRNNLEVMRGIEMLAAASNLPMRIRHEPARQFDVSAMCWIAANCRRAQGGRRRLTSAAPVDNVDAISSDLAPRQ